MGYSFHLVCGVLAQSEGGQWGYLMKNVVGLLPQCAVWKHESEQVDPEIQGAQKDLSQH